MGTGQPPTHDGAERATATVLSPVQHNITAAAYIYIVEGGRVARASQWRLLVQRRAAALSTRKYIPHGKVWCVVPHSKVWCVVPHSKVWFVIPHSKVWYHMVSVVCGTT